MELKGYWSISRNPKTESTTGPQLESLYVPRLLFCMWTAASLSKVTFLIYTSFWMNLLNSPSLQTGLHCLHSMNLNMAAPQHLSLYILVL